jgi:exopolysaccharide/PEP-CTERM locus tyrosine autokinase
MSLIEQAARRLEELRRAGAEIPDAAPRPAVAKVASAALKQAAVQAEAPAHDARAAVEARSIALNLESIASFGIVTPDAPRTRIADEFRVIKRSLITNVLGKGAAAIRNGNLIMVTSALPGEGKTFTAVNLAMSIAMELDHTVLLVDADVAHPSLPEILGVPATPGLLDVLVDKSVDLSQVLLRTNVEKLSVLLSGTPHSRATELLACEAMNQLLKDLASRYADRIIIFDSPPLLVTTEARVLATHMGQILVVVEAEKTAQAALKQALATIEACPIKLLALNKGRSITDGGTYGYGYGYGYDYGYRR